ncbi:MAG TPA: nucleotide exchange factor GrpE [Candidatus Paceibacterota bacterium]|jgi:molecular chaperone GrpE|nr:nucleotide exchange factor GrpE [Candidatus Paceibacterota bacterium]
MEEAPKGPEIKTETELEKLKTERDEYLAGWQRAKADFANSKKQNDAMMKEFRTMANEGLIEELIPVLSSFEMAFANKVTWEKADKNWRSGVEYIYGQLKGVLDQNGLKELNPIGEKFDPNFHEAVRYERTADAAQDHGILSVVEKGYKLGAKLVRPAKVVVAEASSAQSEPKSE